MGLAVVAAAVAGVVLHVLGVGGYRTGFFGVFIPLAALTGFVTWFGLRGRQDRGLWTTALVVGAATLAGTLTSAAPPSRGVLLEDARELLPPFYEEVSHESSGHSWCRPTCPGVTIVATPPGTGAPAVMLEVASGLFRRGVLSQEDLASITRQRTFEVSDADVQYVVRLQGEGAERRLHLSLAAK